MTGNNRMCISCRTRLPKEKLIRINLLKSGEIVISDKKLPNSRAVYICKNDACIENVVRKKLLNRVTKKNINDEVYNSLKIQKT